jgi:tetratricopeptide (TPR) repeat protein
MKLKKIMLILFLVVVGNAFGQMLPTPTLTPSKIEFKKFSSALDAYKYAQYETGENPNDEQRLNAYQQAEKLETNAGDKFYEVILQGEILLGMKRYEDAINAFQKAVSLNPYADSEGPHVKDLLTDLEYAKKEDLNARGLIATPTPIEQDPRLETAAGRAQWWESRFLDGLQQVVDQNPEFGQELTSYNIILKRCETKEQYVEEVFKFHTYSSLPEVAREVEVMTAMESIKVVNEKEFERVGDFLYNSIEHPPDQKSQNILYLVLKHDLLATNVSKIVNDDKEP